MALETAADSQRLYVSCRTVDMCFAVFQCRHCFLCVFCEGNFWMEQNCYWFVRFRLFHRTTVRRFFYARDRFSIVKWIFAVVVIWPCGKCLAHSKKAFTETADGLSCAVHFFRLLRVTIRKATSYHTNTEQNLWSKHFEHVCTIIPRASRNRRWWIPH